jgi:hypothetical protein
VVAAVQTQIRQPAWQVVLAVAQDALARQIPAAQATRRTYRHRKATTAATTRALQILAQAVAAARLPSAQMAPRPQAAMGEAARLRQFRGRRQPTQAAVVAAPLMAARLARAVQAAAAVTLERLAATTSALPVRPTQAVAVAAQAHKTPAHM